MWWSSLILWLDVLQMFFGGVFKNHHAGAINEHSH